MISAILSARYNALIAEFLGQVFGSDSNVEMKTQSCFLIK